MQDKFLELFQEALEIEQDVKLTDKFRDYDEWDSLARLSLIALLDDEYEIQIEDADFEGLTTVGDLLNTIQKVQG